jgi:hypothetical protein
VKAIQKASQMFTYLELRQSRLGNALFQVAAVIGAARRHNTQYVLPPWPAGHRMQGHPFPELRRLDGWARYGEPCFHFQPIPPPSPEGTTISGHFQSWKYFDHCLGELRQAFAPNLETRALTCLKTPGLWENDDSVSVHIRRGDYQSLYKGFYVNLDETTYYRRAMREAGCASTHFYIFSDDPEWCRANFSGSNSTIVEPGGSPYIDLIAMSRCRRHIIANSSFSWWGAMLNSNPCARVYCPEPRHWFDGPLAHYDTSDLLPPNWIRVGTD